MTYAKLALVCIISDLCLGSSAALAPSDVGAAEPYDIIDLHFEEGVTSRNRRGPRADAYGHEGRRIHSILDVCGRFDMPIPFKASVSDSSIAFERKAPSAPKG